MAIVGDAFAAQAYVRSGTTGSIGSLSDNHYDIDDLEYFSGGLGQSQDAKKLRRNRRFWSPCPINAEKPSAQLEFGRRERKNQSFFP